MTIQIFRKNFLEIGKQGIFFDQFSFANIKKNELEVTLSGPGFEDRV